MIVRRAIDNDELLVDPCARLKMPVVRNNRTRIEASTTAEALIAALPESEQAFWALALFAGLRRGELRALHVDDIDFEAGVVRVRRGWDDVEGEINPKTFAGARTIPMVGVTCGASAGLTSCRPAATATSCFSAGRRWTRSIPPRFERGR